MNHLALVVTLIAFIGTPAATQQSAPEIPFESVPRPLKYSSDMNLGEVLGVTVNSQGHIVILNHPGSANAGPIWMNSTTQLLEFDEDGEFLREIGKGVYGLAYAHQVRFDDDDNLYLADDDAHMIEKRTKEGKFIFRLGEKEKAAGWQEGDPFNRPTHVAISPVTGEMFITDGYGNSRVHKYTADGQYVLSWGEPGIDAGQFMRPHNVVVDSDDKVYVADRESHRVQIFDADGKFITMWNNIHRPDGMVIGPDGNIYIGELNGMPGVDDAPGLGHRVSILNRRGELLARIGDPEEGEEPGKFIAPHGIAVDSRGDIYVGEVAFTIRGRHMDPPRELKSLKKLRKAG